MITDHATPVFSGYRSIKFSTNNLKVKTVLCFYDKKCELQREWYINKEVNLNIQLKAYNSKLFEPELEFDDDKGILTIKWIIIEGSNALNLPIMISCFCSCIRKADQGHLIARARLDDGIAYVEVV